MIKIVATDLKCIICGKTITLIEDACNGFNSYLECSCGYKRGGFSCKEVLLLTYKKEYKTR